MLAYHESWSLTTLVASGIKTSSPALTITPLSAPSNYLTSNLGKFSFPSSISLGTEPSASSCSTSHTQNGQIRWTASELRVGGRKPLVWQPGLGRVAQMHVVTSSTTTGMRPIGGNFLGFVECIHSLFHAPLTTFSWEHFWRRIFDARSPGASPNEILQPSCLTVTRLRQSTSGVRCETSSI